MSKKGVIFDFNQHDIQLTDEEKHQRIQVKQNRDMLVLYPEIKPQQMVSKGIYHI